MIRSRIALVAAAGTFALALLLGFTLSGASAMGGFQTASSYDDDIDDAKAQQEALEKKIEALEAELEDTDAAIVEAAKKLLETEAKLPAAQAELDEANDKVDEALVQQKLVADKLAAAEAQDQAISDQITADEARIDELQDIVAALARAQYQGVGDDEALGLVFGSTTSQEFIDAFAAEHNASRVQSNALADMEEIAAVNRNRGARQEAVRDYIVELKAEADALVVETQRLQAIAEEKKAALDAIIAEQTAIKKELEAQKAQAIAKQKELAAQQDATRDKIKELVKKKLAEEEAKRKAAEAAANNTGTIAKGVLAYPTAVPYITSSYGMRYHPVLHYWRLHAGTDFRAYCGTPIYAAREGRVQWSTWMSGFGNQVMVDHGIVNGKSLMTSYNHLTRSVVSSGQYVTQGQLLGYSGNTGTSTACHLHFEVYVNGDTVNPMTLIGG
ncbi:M23 family metallopeptidase [Demequina lignilytica]|uniref:Peptidoglycan DD-metalloendopeptidase family protein n=1 Tax=Demequina lignilytica TaxID=3051663 RepID=A0AB35MH74_9MICO|nr:M23 family metallopeptidase [Demequina sp. SYSU T0a273]MDN4483048.1 peptidoglycan DD-metalloendopeptidase family protein [Demequina sp. SYSU T0a273]